MKLSLACVVLVTACGGDDGGSMPTQLTLNAEGTQLAAVHDGSGWSTVPLDALGIAKVDIAGPTLVAAVCDDPSQDFFNYYTIAVGPGTENLDMYCGDGTVGELVHIAAPPTTIVGIGFRTANGGQVSFVRAGTYDVIAADLSMTPPRVEIRRGVAITGETTLTFDLATTGTPMTKVAVTTTGAAAGEIPNRYTTVRLGSLERPTIATWSSANNDDVWVVPETLRKAEDRHSVAASTAIDATNSRTVSHRVGSETAYTLALPPYIATANVTLGAAPSLAWTAADPRAFDNLYFGINSPDFAQLWDLAVLPTWIDAGGDPSKLTIPDPATIPMWNPAWNFPASTPGFEWVLFADHDTETAHTSAMRSGTL